MLICQFLEPKASLPDKFDGTRKNFRGFINQLELVFQLQASRYDTDRKKIAMLGTLLNGNALSWYNPYLEKTGSLPVRSLDLAKVQGQNSALPLAKLIRNKSPRQEFISTGTMLLSDRNFITDSAVKLKMLWYTSTTLLQVSAAMDMAIRIDNRLFERRQEQQTIPSETLFEQFSSSPYHFSLYESANNNKDSLIQDKLQIQSDPTPSSTYLLLGQLQNQAMIWTSTLCKGAHYLL
ncbi:hypothetical protein BASA82_000323 [Batrachochytrium salamandrivorans]|nr:hypothetical protein BASA82_000323 [Batrachochytrium salamandrivorans]